MLAFMWATEHKSFSAAARANDLSPSAVSKLVTRLENRLAVRLFQRGSRTLSLTEEGRAYFRSAQVVMEAMAEADSLAEAFPARLRGTLRIHTMATFAKHQLIPWLPEFLALYPELSVAIEVAAQYVDQFDRGFDIAIHSGVLPDSSRVARRIGEAHWITCAAPSYLKKRGMPLVPADLLQHDCFHFAFNSPWNIWGYEQEGETTVVPVQPRSTFNQGDLLRSVALSGGGIVRLADFHIGDDLKSGRLIPVLEDFRSTNPQPIYLVYPNRKNLSPRVKAFISALEQRIADYPWSI
ncbi:LysR family transcriptional regulator [Pseudomonas sp. NEEL19]|uniref:LysR family transcriptional regulator n=1 Tax=Pseudomonas sp. NEEL19 TaxID=2867409 RepID=UPI0023683EDD|nr:LysR family transcriptional regulator [Pseudomonas sp. NEEL19]WDM61608.1 LysR family transcriptional regulator [Pseudomonas sp. NEEL19]